MDAERIRTLIAEGRLKEALDAIGAEATRDQDVLDDATLLQSRRALLERETAQGVVPEGSLAARQAQIAKATLALLARLPREATSRAPTSASEREGRATAPAATSSSHAPRHRRPLRGFVSYAHARVEDHPRGASAWLAELLVHVAPLVREGLIAAWSDQDIHKGDRWDEAIRQSLEQADFAVLLVDARFLASAYVYEHELPVLLERRRLGMLRVFPMVLETCDLNGTTYRFPDPNDGPHEIRLGDLQAVNALDRPLDAVPRAEANRVLASVASALREFAIRAGRDLPRG
ncbi:MAG TPA: TIR domain-containing protein [Polyangiaceae bacterium]|nr:TIR domain-containing protein [Polyangiaceae bacterium]